MAEGLIWFSQFVAVEGYEWVIHPRIGGLVLKPRALQLELMNQDYRKRVVQPVEREPALFRLFAYLEPAEEAILSFANAHGGLSTLAIEPLEMWLDSIAELRQAVEVYDELVDPEAPMPNRQIDELVNAKLARRVSGVLRWDEQIGRPVLSFRPEDLEIALWVQFAESMRGQVRFRRCAQCGKWFAIDSSATRTSRQFCSNACRNKAYRSRQSSARSLRDAGVSIPEIADRLETTEAVVARWLGVLDK